MTSSLSAQEIGPRGSWMAFLSVYNSGCGLTSKDGDSLTLEQNLTITTSHAWRPKAAPDGWLSNARMTHYQTMLLNPAGITFQVPSALNPVQPRPGSTLAQLLWNLGQVHRI